MHQDENGPATVDRRRAIGLAAGAAAAVAAGSLIGIDPAAAKTKPKPKPKAKPKPTPIGVLMIPKLGVNMVLYQGMDLLNLNAGPSHWPGTPYPGQDGNTVIAGHRTSKHKVFRNIDKLVPGDTFTFSMPAGTFTYRVAVAPYLVNPKKDAAAVLAQPVGKHATLFACHPPGSTKFRIVIRGDLV